MKKALFVALFVGIILIQSVFSQGIKVPVKVVPVLISDISSSIKSIGSIKPMEQIVFSTKIMATIKQITKDEGDFCQKDDLIVEIDSSELLAKLELLEAQKKEIAANVSALKAQSRGVTVNSKNAKKDLDRQKALLKRGSTTQKNLDDIKTKYDALSAQKDMLTARIKSVRGKSDQIDAGKKEIDALLKYTVLKAPFSGYVIQKFNFQGELAKPGAPIIKMLSLDTVKVELIVNEMDIEKVVLGQDIIFSADAFSGISFKSKVDKIIPEGNKLNRSFRIHGIVKNSENSKLKPGMFARGEVIVQKHEKSLLIPKDALMQNGDQFYVFKIEDNKAYQVMVKTGFEDDINIEVLNGLKAQDKIVVIGKENLSDKSSVRVIE